ncbi:hypothetical protein NE237_014842 [Protea cynaroides]|uniref:Uncharacterized protein n=1 Tax=Protea cynaroides TaxID=273540 RepID=A0A9Q0JRU8_9MAGN|nr:hypothetical protein NE237_027371 [Protea cynaroides]KAJ4968141.1 hypothetical protein NE237_014842 [Protea cynaroides]
MNEKEDQESSDMMVAMIFAAFVVENEAAPQAKDGNQGHSCCPIPSQQFVCGESRHPNPRRRKAKPDRSDVKSTNIEALSSGAPTESSEDPLSKSISVPEENFHSQEDESSRAAISQEKRSHEVPDRQSAVEEKPNAVNTQPCVDPSRKIFASDERVNIVQEHLHSIKADGGAVKPCCENPVVKALF